MDKKVWIGIVSIAFVIITCSITEVYAGIFTKNNAEEDSLQKVAKKYWNSKLTGDVITCYQFEDPAFKEKVSLSSYAKHGSLVYKDVKIGGVNIKGASGTIEVKIEYFIPAMGSKAVFKSEFKDKWKKIDKKWYHVTNLEPAFIKMTKKKGGDRKEGR